MVRRGAWVAGGLAAVVALGLCAAHHRPATRGPAPTASAAAMPSAAPDDSAVTASGDDARAHAFRVPSGRAPALTCEAARAIVAQARDQLGYPPESVDARALAEAAADWLDPYGLWSVAPDAPIGTAFERKANALLAEVEGRGSRDCDAAHAIGASLVAWTGELRGLFDEALTSDGATEDAAGAAAAPTFEGATVTRPARALARTLGRRVGAIQREAGASMKPYADAARERYFPNIDADAWADVVLAATVRAYVPAIDPHGAWAPLDEESSVYEVDLEARPPERLWDKAERTAIGIKLESGATAPLADGDVVLSLAGVATAGLSFEQMEQLGYAASEARPPAQAVVLRAGQKTPITTSMDDTSGGAKSGSGGETGDDNLPVDRIEYGEGDAVVVAIHDVHDDLGDELTRSLLVERERAGRPIVGVVLDLRGNGGGSTDGAIDALGLFIPGAPLFPMKRRDGSLETDRAPEPPNVDRWRGPVAAFVDGDTASAAEMLAGALSAYHRGPTVGATTFGKGCAQEYIDDDPHAGVLRLTTLLYALPDGTPVQRVGLAPTIRFPFGAVEANDREAALAHAPPLWRGPDVRDRSLLAHAEDGTWAATWPPHAGNVGPCKDGDLCRALRLLGASPPTARRKAQTKGR
jgi:carboxyl-terminal processing protease